MATSSRPRQRDGTSKLPVRSANNTNTNTRPVVSRAPAPSRSDNSPDSDAVVDSDADADVDEPGFSLPQFYDTSFSAHRVSPLYLGKEKGELTSQRLGILAQRVRDILVGDVVRGVEVGFGGAGEDSVMGRYGALERVGIRWFPLRRLLDIEPTADEEGEEEEDRDENWMGTWRGRLAGLKGKNSSRVLQISLEYENHMFEALLLPGLDTQATGQQDKLQFFIGDGVGNNNLGKGTQRQQKRQMFLCMPLLLLRMPPPLKSVIADFLSTSFDCRVSPLRLGTRSLVSSLEGWFRTVGVSSRGPLAKDVVLWLGFYFPSDKDGVGVGGGQDRGGTGSDEEEGDGTQQQLGLKSIDVSIPVSDLRRFVDAGRELLDRNGHVKRKSRPGTVGVGGGDGGWSWETDLRKRRKLAGRLYEEGWEWRAQQQPFFENDASEEVEEQQQHPFTEALARYIDQHLGLNLFHPAVRVTKVACGGFVISEGKLKVFAPANLGEEDAARVSASSPGRRGGVLELIEGLVEKASVPPERFLP